MRATQFKGLRITNRRFIRQQQQRRKVLRRWSSVTIRNGSWKEESIRIVIFFWFLIFVRWNQEAAFLEQHLLSVSGSLPARSCEIIDTISGNFRLKFRDSVSVTNEQLLQQFSTQFPSLSSVVYIWSSWFFARNNSKHFQVSLQPFNRIMFCANLTPSPLLWDGSDLFLGKG